MLKLKTILKEQDSESVFQNVAFGQKASHNPNAESIAKLQGKLAGEKDTKTESEIAKILQGWFDSGINPKYAEKLYKHFELFKDAKKKYPKIFKPVTSNGTVLYRGLRSMPKSLEDFLKKGTLKSDWKKEKMGRKSYMVYTKPIPYEPENDIQSWTDSKEIGLEFGRTALLMTKQDDSFIFNHNFIALLSNMNERETLHFGKKYSKPVTLAVEAGSYEWYVKIYTK